MSILWQTVSDAVTAATGRTFEVRRHQGVGGGCINSAYRVSDGERRFFIKVNEARQLTMFEAEHAGLGELHRARAVRVPQPVCSGSTAEQAFLVLEDLSLGRANDATARRLGRNLAELHRTRRERFGWERDNTIGSTPQPNPPEPEWVEFWRRHRLGFQLELAARNGASRRVIKRGEKLLERLAVFFTDYDPIPSLLHGDLWGGNWAADEHGEPVIFDPAVYFGDREADLAMTELFGGFPADFYAAYHEAWPLDAGYRERRDLYNLYHLLNHFNLFGGGYLGQANTVIERLLANVS